MIELAPSPQSAAILYAGSAGGGIFRTGDGGAHWQTLPYSAPEVLSSFAVDPRGSSTLWVPSPYFERHNLFEPAVPGLYNGLWLSREGGASWLSPVDQPSLRGTAGGGIAWASSPPFSLYLGSRQGVLHSEDGGRSWSSTFVSSCHNFTALEVAPSDSQRVFALGSAELYPRPCPFLPGAFRSRDGGASWQATTFFPVAIDPLDPDVIYTTANTLSRSTDDGASFVGIAAGLPGGGVKDLAIDPANTDTLYAATLLGVFKSTSAGASWAPASNGLPAGTIDRLAIDPNAPERLYAVAGPRVFTSDDGAASWAEMSTGLPALDPVLDLHVDPVHSNVIYASVAGRGLFRYTRLAPTSLTPGPETLYFSHVRFEAHVAWRDFAGREGRGQARQLTPDSGAFWFFNDQNLELFVKVLDGTGLNGSFWVFF
ncbi:MAG TPA: hypothetical protein PK413_17980, partial [Thermoanaerobaculia bacterium]|nr:hypothetical protein [Thermoanaerobaculia bacterium]